MACATGGCGKTKMMGVSVASSGAKTHQAPSYSSNKSTKILILQEGVRINGLLFPVGTEMSVNENIATMLGSSVEVLG